MIDPKYHPSHYYRSDKLYNGAAKNTLQLYLDYNCQFSAKMFTKFNREIIPVMKEIGLFGKFDVIFMNVVQPWHGFSSAALHEVALAIAKEYPDIYWDVSQLLFDEKEQFYDSVTYPLSRHELNLKIINLIHAKYPQVDKDLIYEDVKINTDSTSHVSNQVTKDVKYFTRYHRTVGVHVTPSVAINGIVVGNIESSTDPLKVIDILKSY